MATSFPRKVRFLAFDSFSSGDRHADRVHVTFPAWAYRVTAPLIPHRGLDLFQRVVLGLCQAGIRAPDRIHELTQLDVGLCKHIIERSRHENLLDRAGDITRKGRDVLRTGTVDVDTEWAVRYVFHDPVTGDLWPRAVERLTDAYVLDVKPDAVVTDLGTAGSPNKVRALRVRLDGISYGAPAEPSPERILEVVRRDRQARIQARVEAFSREKNLGPVPDLAEERSVYAGRIARNEAPQELSRVSFVGAPEPVEILGVVEVTPDDVPGEGWTPHDPFGVGTNAMFRDLVSTWAMRREGELAGRLDRLTKRHNAEFWTVHGKRAQRARTQAEAELIGTYGPRLRDDSAVLQRMITIRVAAHEGEHAAAIALIKQGAFGLFEELLFRLTIAYPLPRAHADPLRQRLAERGRWRRDRGGGRDRGNQGGQGGQRNDRPPPPLWDARVARDMIRNAAAKLGAYDVPQTFLNVSSDALGGLVRSGPDRAQFGLLLAACLITACDRKDHPLRRMLAGRPELLFELDNMRQLRNPLAHRLGETSTVTDDLRWCQELAGVAIPELLKLPSTA